MAEGTHPWLIRQACEGDAEPVARMAQALSRYEGLPPSLFTADSMRRDGFGVGRRFASAVAETNPARPDQTRALIGFVLYYPGYDVATASTGSHLADIFIEAEWRGLGAGRALLAHAARETLAAGGLWMSWTVLRANDAAIKFYRRLNAHEVGVRFMALGKSGLIELAES